MTSTWTSNWKQHFRDSPHARRQDSRLSLFKLRAFLGPQVSFGKLKNIKKLPGNLSPDKTNWSGRAGIGIDLWKVTFDVDYEKGFHKMAPEIKAPRSYNFTLGFKII